jgi:hypothetical protein
VSDQCDVAEGAEAFGDISDCGGCVLIGLRRAADSLSSCVRIKRRTSSLSKLLVQGLTPCPLSEPI